MRLSKTVCTKETTFRQLKGQALFFWTKICYFDLDSKGGAKNNQKWLQIITHLKLNLSSTQFTFVSMLKQTFSLNHLIQKLASRITLWKLLEVVFCWLVNLATNMLWSFDYPTIQYAAQKSFARQTKYLNLVITKTK